MSHNENLRSAFARLREDWAITEAPPLESAVASVVMANIESGRAARVLSLYDVESLTQYVTRVMRLFHEWNPTVSRLQSNPEDPLWPELYRKLIGWAYALLRRHAGFLTHAHLEESALACAAETATVLMNQRFPYDSDFNAWSYVVMQRTTYNHIRHQVNGRSVPEREVVNLEGYEDWLENLGDPNARQPLRDLETSQILIQAIKQLSEWQQTFILLYYIEQRSYVEIARLTGRSPNTLYKTRFDAISALSKILTREGYVYE